MCGIFGFVGYKNTRTSYDAREILKHRGPDAQGCWQDDLVIFQHTRLKIIDLDKRADQPFKAHPGYVLVYNGELYNYAELRNELKKEFVFKTTSDTEVLYYLLIKYGVGVLNRLNGMFGIGFYDVKKRKIFLIRDRYGVKPVYYYHKNGQLIFSSEQKAIYLAVGPKTDHNRLAEYFGYKFNANGFTLAQDIHELKPGHFLEYAVDSDKLTSQRWYHFPGDGHRDTQGLADRIKDLLGEAVSLRTISDVPIGVQLSGGVDSAVITKIVCSHASEKVRSYSISFPGSQYNEETQSLRMAKLLGTQHTQIDYTLNDFLKDWERAVYHNDEPINHPHSLPIMKLTKVAAKEVKVLLSGEGADEVFYGYEEYLGKWKRRNYLGDKEFLKALLFNDEASLKKMLIPDLMRATSLYESRLSLLREGKKNKYNEKFFEFNTHLISLLNRIDKMSMVNAVEIRTPYLDYRLVRLGLAEQKENLIDSDKRKKPLMAIYRDFFKRDVSGIKKIGFRVPFDEWLKKRPMVDRICENLSSLKKDPFFNKGYINDLIHNIHGGAFDHKQIKESWVLSNYALWKNKFKIR